MHATDFGKKKFSGAGGITVGQYYQADIQFLFYFKPCYGKGTWKWNTK